MLVAPVPTGEFLAHVMRAAERCGYAGLVVILARTADARPQHEELTRDWTSLHDVTGSVLALLCPDPDSSALGSAVYGGRAGNVAGVRGESLRLRHSSAESEATFSRHFWDGDLEKYVPHTFDDLFRPRAPRSPRDHQAAWTAAVSRCASYFGVPETLVPSVLILSFWENEAILIRLQPDFSLYALCKELIAHVGPARHRLDLLHQQIADLEWDIRYTKRKQADWDSSDRSRYKRFLAKLPDYDSRLEGTTELDPALVTRCREGLHRAVTNLNDMGDLLADLKSLHRKLCSTNQYPLKHGVAWGILAELQHGLSLGSPERSPHASRLSELSAQLVEARDEEARARGSLSLMAAVLEACHDVVGSAKTTSMPGSGAIQGWPLHIIEHDTNLTLTTRRRRA